MHHPTQIISGGQTGVDQAALRAARQLGIETGGWAPRGWLTEEGPMPTLAVYGLQPSSGANPTRTRQNVEMADATLVVMYDADRDGTALTLQLCRELEKPYWAVSCTLPMPEPAVLSKLHTCRSFLDHYPPAVLNIAGNRESAYPGIGTWTEAFLLNLLADTPTAAM